MGTRMRVGVAGVGRIGQGPAERLMHNSDVSQARKVRGELVLRTFTTAASTCATFGNRVMATCYRR